MSQLLKMHVERAVRPVKADVWRKLRIREELYNAICEICAEERPSAASDEEAIAAAIVRFGSPDSLTLELQQSVPRLEAWTSGFTQSLRQRPRESVGRHALRIGVIYLGLIVALALPVWAVAVSIRGWDALRTATNGMLLLTPALALGAVLCVVAAQIAGRGLQLVPARRWAWLAVVVAGLALPAYLLAVGASLVYAATADASAAQDMVRVMSPLAAGALVLHCVVVLLLDWERRRTAEWESLDLSGQKA